MPGFDPPFVSLPDVRAAGTPGAGTYLWGAVNGAWGVLPASAVGPVASVDGRTGAVTLADLYDPAGAAAAAQAAAVGSSLQRASNLSDLASPAAGRTSLGLGSAATKAANNAANNVPLLDGNAKLASSVLPAIAVGETFTAASQAAMLALSAQAGDSAIRTDDGNHRYLLLGDDPADLTNWVRQLTTTDAPVQSVNAQTGNVILGAADVGAYTTGETDALLAALPTPDLGAVLAAGNDAGGQAVDNLGNTTIAGTGDGVLAADNADHTGNPHLTAGRVAVDAGAFLQYVRDDGGGGTNYAAVGVHGHAAGLLVYPNGDFATVGGYVGTLAIDNAGHTGNPLLTAGQAVVDGGAYFLYLRDDGDGGSNYVRLGVHGHDAGLVVDADGNAASAGDCSAATFTLNGVTIAGWPAGTVTSVDLTVPSWLSVAGGPVTGSGTFVVSAASGLAAARVLATPAGATGAVSLISLGAAHIPATLNPTTFAGTVGATTATFTGTGTSAYAGSVTVAGTNSAGRYLGGIVTLTDAATIATDASLGNTFSVTLGGSRTLGNPTNPTDGQRVTWRVRQDATGGRVLSLDTKLKLPAELSALAMTTAANTVSLLAAVYDVTLDRWLVIPPLSGYAA